MNRSSSAGRGGKPVPLGKAARAEMKKFASVCIGSMAREGVRLSPDEEGVRHLDQLIWDARSEKLTPETWSALKWGFGTILGEAMVQSHKGRWVRGDGLLGVEIEETGLVIEPFIWVEASYWDENQPVYEKYRILSEVVDAIKAGKIPTAMEGALN